MESPNVSSEPFADMAREFEHLWKAPEFKELWCQLDTACWIVAHLAAPRKSRAEDPKLRDLMNRERDRPFDSRNSLWSTRDEREDGVELRESLAKAIGGAIHGPAWFTADDLFESVLEHLVVPRSIYLADATNIDLLVQMKTPATPSELRLVRISLASRSCQRWDGPRIDLGPAPLNPAEVSRVVTTKIGTYVHLVTRFASVPTEATYLDLHSKGALPNVTSMQGNASTHVYSNVVGWGSERAMDLVRDEARSLMTSMIRTLSVVRYGNRSSPHSCCELIEALSLCYYVGGKSRRSLEARIQSAQRLLMQADAQSDDMVAVVLLVAAMEALVVEKEQSITEQLSMNIATLLEPDGSKRETKEEMVRALYRARSRLVHGDDHKGHQVYRHRVRDLAAAVLVTVMWSYKVIKGEEENTEVAFFGRLRNAQRRAIGMPGVPVQTDLGIFVDILTRQVLGP